VTSPQPPAGPQTPASPQLPASSRPRHRRLLAGIVGLLLLAGCIAEMARHGGITIWAGRLGQMMDAGIAAIKRTLESGD